MSQVEFCGFYDQNTGKCQIREVVEQKLSGVDATKQALVVALRGLAETPPSNAKVKSREWTCNRGHLGTADPSVFQRQLGCNRIGTAKALKSI